MNKTVLFVVVLAAGVSLGTFSQAAYIVDTGAPPTSLPDPPFLDLKYAGEFFVEQAMTVTSIEHFMLVEQAGFASFKIYRDGGDTPGGSLYSTGRSLTPGGPDWQGVLVPDWELAPGTYWVSIEPQFGGSLVGRTYKGAPNPLGNEVRTLWSNSPWFDIDSWNLGWRIDGTYVLGGNEENPILPDGGGGGDAFVFDGVSGDGNWFDPPLTNGYIYETDGGSNFVQVGLPLSVPDADGVYTVHFGPSESVEVAAGDYFTFPDPIDKFTVLGIDPAVDGGDPIAFPTYLQFDQSNVNFTMRPIPEPSAALLVVLGLLGVSLSTRSERTRPSN